MLGWALDHPAAWAIVLIPVAFALVAGDDVDIVVAVIGIALTALAVLAGRAYAPAVQALLEDGPMQGKTVEVEAVEGRPPKTVDVPDEKGGTCRYCLAQWAQEGTTAAYTFLYAV